VIAAVEILAWLGFTVSLIAYAFGQWRLLVERSTRYGDPPRLWPDSVSPGSVARYFAAHRRAMAPTTDKKLTRIQRQVRWSGPLALGFLLALIILR
jgi:hypothetical protein